MTNTATTYKPNSPPLSDYERDDRESKVLLDMLEDPERRRKQQQEQTKKD
jgi:hypothetical protein